MPSSAPFSSTKDERVLLGPSAPRRAAGLAQLSLVEHALCPLDDQQALKAPLVYDTGYFRTDSNRHQRWVPVRVLAQLGLSASDEFYLWGLLALAFAQPKPTLEFWATPHWCLKHLGCLDSSKGGKQYAQFRSVLRRLAGATYSCQRFYDPLRKEERDRAFGFLKYDLPTNDDSSRAWRIVWDPLFFEYCQAKGGRMNFDLALYRSLDPASRRLFLLLSKIFWRRPVSPRFDVHHLCVHVLGFSPTLPTKYLKRKLVRCLQRLLDAEVICLPQDSLTISDLFQKKAVGSYAFTIARGSYFERSPTTMAKSKAIESPLAEPLGAIGFKEHTIRWIIRTYPAKLIEVWSDVTLAAMESRRDGFFRVSPQAFMLDNLKQAAAGRRTPPDWWRELRKRRTEIAASEALQNETILLEEYREMFERAKRQAFKEFLQREVPKQEYDRHVTQFVEIYQATMPAQEAMEAACSEADRHFAARFEFPRFEEWLESQTLN